MTAELVRGQNHPLSQVRLEIRVSAGKPIVAGATLSDEQGRVRGVEWVAHPGAPTLPGLEVSRQAAADHRLAFDLDALPEAVHRVSVLLALPSGVGGPVRFGAVAAPFVAVTGLDGSEVASYTITGLDAESAVVALELYRRQGAWKVRAVGQGYAGGLAELLTDQGLPEAQQLAGSINEAVAQGLARSVAAPPPRTSDGDRSRQAATSALERDQPYAGRPRAPPGTYRRSTSPSPTRPAPKARRAADGHPAGPAQPDPSAVTQPVRRRCRRPGQLQPPRPAGRRASAAPADRAPGPAGAARAARRGRRDRLVHGGAALQPGVGHVRGPGPHHRRVPQRRRLRRLAYGAGARQGPVRPAQPDRRPGRRRARGRPAKHAAAGRPGPGGPRPRPRPAHRRGRGRRARAARRPSRAGTTRSGTATGCPMEIPMALRLGDLHLPESAGLRIPMLVRLPLERGLWIDSGRAGSSTTRSPTPTSCAASPWTRRWRIAARLLAVYPAGEFTVHVIDPAGSGASSLAPARAVRRARRPAGRRRRRG